MSKQIIKLALIQQTGCPFITNGEFQITLNDFLKSNRSPTTSISKDDWITIVSASQQLNTLSLFSLSLTQTRLAPIIYNLEGNKILCDSKNPGIVINTNKVFFDIYPEGKHYIFKIISPLHTRKISELNRRMISHFDHNGDNVDYMGKPGFAIYDGEFITKFFHKTKKCPTKMLFGNTVTQNYLCFDFENCVGQFNGYNFRLTDIDLENYKTKIGSKEQSIPRTLVIEPKEHIDPEEYFPFISI